MPFPAPRDLLGPSIDPPSSLASPCTGKWILFTTDPLGKPFIHLQMEINAMSENKQGKEFEGAKTTPGKRVQVKSLWVENVSRDLSEGGVQIIWLFQAERKDSAKSWRWA